MDEYNNEAADYAEDEAVEEELFESAELEVEVEEEMTEAQKAEAADLAKLLRQHPEIWIPYEEQIAEKLTTKAPGSADNSETLMTNLRDLKTVDKNHKTYPFLTQYEKTKILSFRASQICNGAKPYILVPEGVTDSYQIAKMELAVKRLPFIVKRPLPDGDYEVWRLADLVVF